MNNVRTLVLTGYGSTAAGRVSDAAAPAVAQFCN